MALVYTREDKDEEWYLSSDLYTEGDETKSARAATAAELAQYCDEVLELENYHSLVGVHARLLAILESRTSPAKAKAIMRDLAEQGGIYGLR